MTLASDWAARLSAQRQKELTNPDEPAATTVDATRRDAAVADAKAEFRLRTGLTFDEADAQHVALGVQGVTAYLYSYRGLPGGDATQKALDDWRRLLALKVALLPKSSSVLTPSEPDTAGGDVRPDFDRDQLAALVPGAPTGQQSAARPFQ